MAPTPLRIVPRLDRIHPSHRLMAFAIALIAALVSPVHAQFDFGLGGGGRDQAPMFNDSRDEVSTSLLISKTEANPGADLIAAVILDINPGWHAWPGPGISEEGLAEFDGAIRTELSMPTTSDGPVRPHPGFAIWPEIHGVEADLGDGPATYAVYEGRAAILVPVTVAADAAPGTYDLEVAISFQCCDDQTCLAPASETLEATVTVVAAGTVPAGADNEADPAFAGFDPAVFARIRGGETGYEGDPATSMHIYARRP